MGAAGSAAGHPLADTPAPRCAQLSSSECARHLRGLDLALRALNVNTEPGTAEEETSRLGGPRRCKMGGREPGGPATPSSLSPWWCRAQQLLQEAIQALRLHLAGPVCPFPVPSELVSLAAVLTGGGDPGCREGSDPGLQERQ